MIPVCLKMFEWAKYTKTKGAVKVHTVLDNRSIMPLYAVVTDGKTADVKVARGLKFERGTILVMDRGYEYENTRGACSCEPETGISLRCDGVTMRSFKPG